MKPKLFILILYTEGASIFLNIISKGKAPYNSYLPLKCNNSNWSLTE